MKIGRNDPCLCGSGKKYKKCCLSQYSDKAALEFVKRTKEVYGDRLLVDTPDDFPKLSAMILDLAADLLASAPDKQDQQYAIMLSCLAWNLALISDPQEQEVQMNHFFELGETEAELREVIRPVIWDLILRKNLLYPDIDRYIIDYQLIEQHGELRLNVVSSAPGLLAD